MTGVDRVSVEVVKALSNDPRITRLILVHPPSKSIIADPFRNLSEINTRKIEIKSYGKLRGHLWEQLALPFAYKKHVLLSLCSTGPIFRKKHAVFIHDTQVWDFPKAYTRTFRIVYRIILSLVGRTATHVFTGSDFSKQRIQSVKLTKKNIPTVIYHGSEHVIKNDSEPQILAKLNLQKNDYLLLINSFSAHKNIDIIQKSHKKSLPKLVIVGNPNSRVFMNSLRTDTTGRVIFAGRLNDGELRAIYENAIALLFPSLTEGFGLPTIEAMRCGCPVIATTSGAVPEVCKEAALYVDPYEEKKWTEAMWAVSTDKQLQQKLIEAGLRRSTKFTWRESACRILDVLHEI